jgi:serine/threonine protein kinase
MIANQKRSESMGWGVPLIADHALLSPIASGGYGQVWLARSALGTYRAIKLVHRANFDHDRPFEREFAGIQKYEPVSRCHEGLVDLLQVGRNETEGYFYYVMELADAVEEPKSENRRPKEGRSPNGEYLVTAETQTAPLNARSLGTYVPRTLKSDIARRGRLSFEECIQVGLSLSSALAYLHGQGLVHRDIKPSNVIFVEGVPKLADVGLVTSVGETRSYVGTEGFIAPEGPGTPQADIYSLGIVLYVMSTGKSHQDFPEPLSDLANQPDHAQWLEFNQVIHKACRAEVRERYQSAQEMHEELALLQRGESITTRRATLRRWGIAKKVGITALVVVMLLLALPFLRQGKQQYTPKPEAERAYELGRWYYHQLTVEAHQKALQYLNQAVQLDPKFLDPYREMVAIYVWGRAGIVNHSLQKTKEIAEKVMAIDANRAEGHAALSWHKFLQKDWHGAEEEIVRAIKLNPKLGIARDVYAFYLSMLGRTEEAKVQAQQAQEIDPIARTSALVASWPLIAERHYDLAIAQLQRVIELDRNFAETHQFLGKCHEAQSNYLAAIEDFRTGDLLEGGDPARVAAAYDGLRQAYEASGQQGYFRKWIELIHADEALPDEQKLFGMGDLAPCYAQLGEKQKALDELESHFDEPGVWWQVKFEPLYPPLYNEPRFKALLKRAGFEK